jgi:hypothetical protein
MGDSNISDSPGRAIDKARTRILKIESKVNAGSYRPGEWMRLVVDVERRPIAERAALSEDLSRASRLLHRRRVARALSIQSAIAFEIGTVVLGAILIAIGGVADSNLLAVMGVFAWIVAFQPLIKYAAGHALGIGFEYAYLLGIEPRLKMKYGSYVAAPRWARTLLHLAGTLGSPFGALLGCIAMPSHLILARHICSAAFWAVTLLNLVLLIAGLAGIRKIFGFGMTLSSGGAAAREIREAIRLGDFC